jgi:hypothetical protein
MGNKHSNRWSHAAQNLRAKTGHNEGSMTEDKFYNGYAPELQSSKW